MIATSSTRPETLFYLFQKMQGLSIIFFNNAMMARFESRSHDVVEAGGSLSGESLTEDYLALLKRYYGPAVTIEAPYAREWMRVPHFYDAFYNWQYVPCIAAAVHFSARIRKGDASDRERYLGVLRAGGSDYGYDILRNAGVDLADPVPYRELVRDFADTIDRAEALI